MRINNFEEQNKGMALEIIAERMPRTEREVFLEGCSTASLNDYARNEEKAINNLREATKGMNIAQKEIFFEGYKIYQELD
jgi:hypothetical protein